MTIAVKIVVEPNDQHTIDLLDGQYKKQKRVLHRFTQQENEWVGHVWSGRNLILEEASLTEE